MVDVTEFEFYMMAGDPAEKRLTINGQMSLLVKRNHVLAKTLGRLLSETGNGVFVISARLVECICTAGGLNIVEEMMTLPVDYTVLASRFSQFLEDVHKLGLDTSLCTTAELIRQIRELSTKLSKLKLEITEADVYRSIDSSVLKSGLRTPLEF